MIDVINLQQQNFKEIMEEMPSVYGWDILEDNGLLALKAPASIPLVNFVWGIPTENNIEQIKLFFGEHEYYWILTTEQKDRLIPQNSIVFPSPTAFPEMVLEIDLYHKPVLSPNIDVIMASTDSELQLWTDTAIATFGFNETGFKEFFYPLIKVAKCAPFLIFYNNEPVATSLAYCGKNIMGIYAMSTKPDFRRKGLGSAAVHACITLAIRKNIKHAILYASELGQPLYNKLGFKVVQTLHEYHFTHSNGRQS